MPNPTTKMKKPKPKNKGNAMLKYALPFSLVITLELMAMIHVSE